MPSAPDAQRHYWRGGVAAGSAVPESAGGVVLLSEFGVAEESGVAGAVLSGVAVLSAGAVCSAGGSVS